MKRVLLTGGRGTLGRPTAQALMEAGHDVTITTRKPDWEADKPRQARFDLKTGNGVEQAIVGRDVIVHVASDTDRFGKNDAAGTAVLLDAAKAHRIPHFIYISIVGCDEIPGFAYYRRKTAVEEMVKASGVPYTILRTTQYYDFPAVIADRLSKLYFTIAPKGVRFQAMDVNVAARRLAELAGMEPQGRVADMGGREVYTLSDMMRSYLEAKGKKSRVLAVPFFGKGYQGFVEGHNLCPNGIVDEGETWDEWLERVPRR